MRGRWGRLFLVAALVSVVFSPSSAPSDSCGEPISIPPVPTDSLPDEVAEILNETLEKLPPCHNVPLVSWGVAPPADCTIPVGPGWICFKKPWPTAKPQAIGWPITPSAWPKVRSVGDSVMVYSYPLPSVSILVQMRWV